MIVHEIIIDNDNERFASLQHLNTSASTSMGDNQVCAGNVLTETWFVLVCVGGQDAPLGVPLAQVTLSTLDSEGGVAMLGQTLLHLC